VLSAARFGISGAPDARQVNSTMAFLAIYTATGFRRKAARRWNSVR
jgi:hypothetical protein